MSLLRRALNSSPRLKRIAKSLYAMAARTPQITYEEITDETIRALVGKPDPTIVEIGCNDGTHTLRFLEIFERPTIYCFEPDPRAAARFRRNVGSRPNVQLTEIAISAQDGTITFHQSGGQRDAGGAQDMPEGWDLSGSIRPPTGHLEALPAVTFTHKLMVPTATLDTWCRDHDVTRIDFLWMDVQGAEGDVISGGTRTIANTRVLYTECSDTEQYAGQLTTRALLSALHSFAVVRRYPNDILLINKEMEGRTGRLLTPTNQPSTAANLRGPRP